jgi:hypothetical protein
MWFPTTYTFFEETRITTLTTDSRKSHSGDSGQRKIRSTVATMLWRQLERTINTTIRGNKQCEGTRFNGTGKNMAIGSSSHVVVVHRTTDSRKSTRLQVFSLLVVLVPPPSDRAEQAGDQGWNDKRGGCRVLVGVQARENEPENGDHWAHQRARDNIVVSARFVQR